MMNYGLKFLIAASALPATSASAPAAADGWSVSAPAAVHGFKVQSESKGLRSSASSDASIANVQVESESSFVPHYVGDAGPVKFCNTSSSETNKVYLNNEPRNIFEKTGDDKLPSYGSYCTSDGQTDVWYNVIYDVITCADIADFNKLGMKVDFKMAGTPFLRSSGWKASYGFGELAIDMSQYKKGCFCTYQAGATKFKYNPVQFEMAPSIHPACSNVTATKSDAKILHPAASDSHLKCDSVPHFLIFNDQTGAEDLVEEKFP